MKKETIKRFVMQMLSSSAMFCAVLVSNIHCTVFFHQEKEPDSVRKLRRF